MSWTYRRDGIIELLDGDAKGVAVAETRQGEKHPLFQSHGLPGGHPRILL